MLLIENANGYLEYKDSETKEDVINILEAMIQHVKAPEHTHGKLGLTNNLDAYAFIGQLLGQQR